MATAAAWLPKPAVSTIRISVPFGKRRQQLRQSLGVRLGVGMDRPAFVRLGNPAMRRPIRVGVEQRDVGTLLGQGTGQDDRKQRLADATFTGSQGDHGHSDGIYGFISFCIAVMCGLRIPVNPYTVIHPVSRFPVTKPDHPEL